MTQNHMRVFTEVYRCLNMTRAAENLNMAQPAVTRIIKEIESFYRIRLFERYSKGLYPTEKARELYFRAEGILAAFGKMEKELKDNDSTGTIRIGSTIALGIYMLPRLVKDLRERRPKLDIRVDIENGAALERRLVRNELDLAFIEGPVTDRNLVKKPIMLERLVMIASPESKVGDTIDLEQLASLPLICRESGSVTRAYLEGLFTSREIVIEPIWESESSHAIINAVHEDIGVSVLPEKIVAHFIQTGWVRKVNLSDANLTRTDHLVHHKDKYISEVMRDLLEVDYRKDYSRFRYEN